MWMRHSEYKGRVIFWRRAAEGGRIWGIGTVHETGMIEEPTYGFNQTLSGVRARIRRLVCQEEHEAAYQARVAEKLAERATPAWRDLEAESEQVEENLLRESEARMNQYGIEH